MRRRLQLYYSLIGSALAVPGSGAGVSSSVTTRQWESPAQPSEYLNSPGQYQFVLPSGIYINGA